MVVLVDLIARYERSLLSFVSDSIFLSQRKLLLILLIELLKRRFAHHRFFGSSDEGSGPGVRQVPGRDRREDDEIRDREFPRGDGDRLSGRRRVRAFPEVRPRQALGSARLPLQGRGPQASSRAGSAVAERDRRRAQ